LRPVGWGRPALASCASGAVRWTVSPHYHYIGYDPLANGLDVTHAATLLAMTAIFVVLAAVVFERRDLRG
jgi:hypothetical protein